MKYLHAGLIVALCWWGSTAQSAMLTVVGGQLTGATGVDVNGTLYDVSFMDGSCISLFSGCDSSSDFTFSTPAQISAAAQALLDQVWINGPAGAFDTLPYLTSGCAGATQFCLAQIPRAVAGGTVTVGRATNRNSIDLDGIAPGQIIASADTSQSPLLTWAIFSPVKPSQVPLPGTLILLMSGLFGLIILRRVQAH